MIAYLRAIGIDAWFNTVELFRIPAYSVPTLVLPAMLYAFFGLSYARTADEARLTLASYAAFAVIGVAFFQFGVGIATDRESSWDSYVRTLPIAGSARFLARLLSALLFATSTAAIVVTVGVLVGHVTMTQRSWLEFVCALFVGGVVFGVIGIALGYWTSAKASVPVANLLYLPLAFIGGLWIPPQFLPSAVAAISPWTPTRQFGEIVWSSATGAGWQLGALGVLALYAAIFSIVALWGYRRNEMRRFS